MKAALALALVVAGLALAAGQMMVRRPSFAAESVVGWRRVERRVVGWRRVERRARGDR